MGSQRSLRSRTPNPYPRVKVRTFKSFHEAEDYADNQATRLGVDTIQIAKAKRKRGVTLFKSNPAIVTSREGKQKSKKKK